MSCPVCGSMFLVIETETPPKRGYKTVGWRCKGCGKAFSFTVQA